MEALWLEWFGQLGVAIESAQVLAWRLAGRECVSNQARELYGQLEAARIELESLRGLRGQTSLAADADWLEKLGWSSALLDPPA